MWFALQETGFVKAVFVEQMVLWENVLYEMTD